MTKLGNSMFFKKVRDGFRAQGVSGVARRAIAYAYRRGVRPYIPPRESVYYAGIPTGFDRKWSDRVVPTSWIPDEYVDQPDYEAALVAGLNETIRPGDSVVVVGGGVGVTTIAAALRTGSSGTVEC